jgi:putative FmdB family regulatory protein
MPIYEYRCSRCGELFEYIKGVPEPDLELPCQSCGETANLVPSVPVMRPDSYWAGHMDDTFGYVTSRSELKRKEQAAGLRRKEDGDEYQAKVARASREAKEDKIRREAVGSVVQDMVI